MKNRKDSPAPKSRADFPRVLVRAFRDEPRALWLFNDGDTHVVVGNEDGSAIIGFPRSLVFEYDDTLFHDLYDAFVASDAEKVAQEWRNAAPLRRRTGPEPERLGLEGDWQDTMGKAMERGKPGAAMDSGT